MRRWKAALNFWLTALRVDRACPERTDPLALSYLTVTKNSEKGGQLC
jgi:hypothetical protein